MSTPQSASQNNGLNSSFVGFRCLRDDSHFFPADSTVGDDGFGCPTCYAAGYPSSVAIEHNDDRNFDWDMTDSGMTAYAHRLAYTVFPTLGEGNTAIVELPDLARTLGIKGLWVKNEGANPTGSHKDRMSPAACARARALGRHTVVCASSGNAGASLAAYAARAGLECKVIAGPQISPAWEAAICATGAQLLTTKTMKERWAYMEKMVKDKGWYPVTNFLDPPVGSNPFGVQGYETIAWEIRDQLEESPPTHIVVPTARGDLLSGIWHGYLRSTKAGVRVVCPKMIAVEPFERLAWVLDGDKDYRGHFSADNSHSMSSIGGDTVTYQSVRAIKESDGTVVAVDDLLAVPAREALARCGLFVELSAAAALAALHQLKSQGRLPRRAEVLLILTSHGYKDPTIGFTPRRQEVSLND